MVPRMDLKPWFAYVLCLPLRAALVDLSIHAVNSVMKFLYRDAHLQMTTVWVVDLFSGFMVTQPLGIQRPHLLECS